MEPTSAVPLAARIIGFVKAMPEWFRAVALGAVLVLLTLYMQGGSSEAVAANEVAIVRTETKVDRQQSQLDRIEGKVDRLIMKLIPAPGQ